MSINSKFFIEMPRLKDVWNYVGVHMQKELLGHLQFVMVLAYEIQKEFPSTNKECVLVAAIIHDIGRPNSSEIRPHELIGSEQVYEILPGFGYSRDEIALISGCVLRHNGKMGFDNMEQEIVSNADAGSKVLYHEAFMLLNKKESYIDRVIWCQKYLEKGHSLVTIPSLKKLVEPKYNELSSIYKRILNFTDE